MAKTRAAATKAARKASRSATANKRRPAKKAARKKSTKKRRAAARTPAAALDSAPLRPKAGELIVRMYRQGLGDCFLLAVGTDRSPKYVLIDCGVHVRQTDGNKRLAQVMRQIRDATGGHIHVVVATHEHADHLSGFVQNGTPFLDDNLTIDRLWVAWTEEIGNTQADKLRKKRGTARRIIDQAVKKAREAANEPLAAFMEDILRFETPADKDFDEAQSRAVLDKINRLARARPDRREMLSGFVNRFSGTGPLAAAASPKKIKPTSNELALGLLAMKAGQQEYGEPGGVLKIPSVSNIRAYVLGPPRNEKLLKKDLPSKVRGGLHHEFQETYLAGQPSARAFLESPALNAGDEENSEHTVLPSDLRHPFARSYRRKLGKDGPPFLETYYRKEDAWRTIDTDWLAAGEQLALNLDSDTNNTSLALAFELGKPGEGPVLLFPADAQVGNWLSWRDQTYSAGGKTVSADDLLRRTIIYKVGHHGSHNSTLKKDPRDKSVEGGAPFGLELMDDIIAMIPVDRDAADKRMPNPWRMPHQPLYERLREKARRRVLRSDLRIDPLENEEPDVKPKSAEWRTIPGQTALEWRASPETFTDGTSGPLYYDLKVPVPG